MAGDTKKKGSMTVRRWVRETNLFAAFVLFLLCILATVFSSSGEHTVGLMLVANRTVVIETSNLHVGAVFVGALSIQIVGHVVAACQSQAAAEAVLASEKLISKAAALVGSMPLMHAAVLVGVAHVIDAWAVFAIFALVLLVLCMLFVYERHDDLHGQTVLPVMLVMILYTAFWAMVWASGKRDMYSTAQLAGFTAGLLSLIVAYLIVVCRTSKHINNLVTKKHPGAGVHEQRAAGLLRREAAYVCVTVGFSMVSTAAWISQAAARDATATRPAVAISVVVVLLFFLCYSVTDRLRHVTYDKVQLPGHIPELLLSDDTSDDEGVNQASLATSVYTISNTAAFSE
jgi:hypothetical protein